MVWAKVKQVHEWSRKKAWAALSGLAAVIYKVCQDLGYIPPDVVVLPILVGLFVALCLYVLLTSKWFIAGLRYCYLKIGNRMWSFVFAGLLGALCGAIFAIAGLKLFEMHEHHIKSLSAKESASKPPEASIANPVVPAQTAAVQPSSPPTYPPSPRVKTPRVHEGTSDPFGEFDNAQFIEWGTPIREAIRKALSDWKDQTNANRKQLAMMEKSGMAINNEQIRTSRAAANGRLKMTFRPYAHNALLYRREIVNRVPGGDTNSIAEGLYRSVEQEPSVYVEHEFEIELILKDLDDLTARLQNSKQP